MLLPHLSTPRGPSPRGALTLAAPGAGRAGLGAGAASPGAGPGSPEQDLQRRTALRRAEDRLRAARARPGAVGCRRDPRGAAGRAPTPGPSHSPWPRAGGEVAAPVEGGGAVRAPQRVRAVPAHSAPRAGRRALRGGSSRDGGREGRATHPAPSPIPGTRPGWTAGWGARRGGVVWGPSPRGRVSGCSPGKPGAPASLLLGGSGPPSGLAKGSPKWHSPNEA